MSEAKHAPLLPCPFCGANDAKLFENSYSDMAWVSCIACGLEAPSETGVKADQAVDYWNTRSYASSQAEIARLREALKPFASLADWPLFGLEDAEAVQCRVYNAGAETWKAGFGISVAEFRRARAALSVQP